MKVALSENVPDFHARGLSTRIPWPLVDRMCQNISRFNLLLLLYPQGPYVPRAYYSECSGDSLLEIDGLFCDRAEQCFRTLDSEKHACVGTRPDYGSPRSGADVR